LPKLDWEAKFEMPLERHSNVHSRRFRRLREAQKSQSLNRISYYEEFANYLGVTIADDEVLGCANMKQFTSDSSAALPIYWEEDWSWNSQSSDGRSYKCQLVNYQTFL